MLWSAVILLIALIALILANALFVAVEFSYLTVNRNDLQRRIDGGDKTAALVDKALTKTSTNLSGAQLGITVSSLVAGFLTGPSVGVLLREGFGLTGLGDGMVTAISTTGAFILVTFTQMVFGELVPKNWAIAQPMRVADLVVRPQNVFMFLFGWLVKILNGSANRILRWLGFTPEEEAASARTAEELLAVVSRSGDEGTLVASTAELVARSIEFGDRTAADVMTPRPRVRFIEDETVAQALDAVAETGHARFPIFSDNVDDVTGVIHYNRLLGVPYDERATTPAASVAEPVHVVSESMTLDPLMRELRETPTQLAVVVDEYGGTAGIVTLEDLVEEIVGEIDDEQDGGVRLHHRIDDSTMLISGLMRPDELGDLIDLDLPEGEESDTIGGLITEKLDRMAHVGDVVRVDALDHVNRDEDDLPTTAEVELRVQKMARRRVGRVRVTVTRKENA
ncbi:hemolysin family protein [Corynebacterium freneyi]|uniref:CBS domain containing-hemolysin-like protein n=1 Tax=Corynebacterium freneyi TaxID=134034 RepID=A0ABS4U8D6_9CORY|nr:hemolysin family protein [Corynebacterium freneyi]MBP2332441.1 CBS domain containing-hemolysin-like protein [Corynebacterium freneyi]QXA53371.1 hemolysin family protein [Corynebacterium freneyi]WJZ05453.1 Hemolysin C [Corynebacterium freneyi]